MSAFYPKSIGLGGAFWQTKKCYKKDKNRGRFAIFIISFSLTLTFLRGYHKLRRQ